VESAKIASLLPSLLISHINLKFVAISSAPSPSLSQIPIVDCGKYAPHQNKIGEDITSTSQDRFN
jgi:hypothetical protein